MKVLIHPGGVVNDVFYLHHQLVLGWPVVQFVSLPSRNKFYGQNVWLQSESVELRSYRLSFCMPGCPVLMVGQCTGAIRDPGKQFEHWERRSSLTAMRFRHCGVLQALRLVQSSNF